MTFGRRTPELFDSVESSQLQRDVVATVVHDLTSITSALALRVEAAQGSLSERDTQAVATLTAQLRAATRPLIWLRGSPGRGALSPVRTIEVSTWWHHTSPVVCGLLPRGTRVTPATDDVSATAHLLPSEDLALFLMMMMGACRHYSHLYPVGATALHVDLPNDCHLTPTVAFQLSTTSDTSLELLATRSTRWKRFCVRTAMRAGLNLSWWQPVAEEPNAWRWSVCKSGEDS